MADQDKQRAAVNNMICRQFNKIAKYLSILVLGLFIMLIIRYSPGIYSTAKLYFEYRSETVDLGKAQSIDVYFDDQLKRYIPTEEIPFYVREIRDVAVDEIIGSSACAFTIKLVFTFQDKSTCDVLIGTDGCRQIQLESGLQSSFPFNGKLTELEKEYRSSQNESQKGDML